MLSEENKSFIKSHALQVFPDEACGFIVKNENVFDVIKSKNTASDKRHHFQTDPADYLAASKRGDVVAVYHSHAFKEYDMSQDDQLSGDGHNLNMVLYNVESDSFVCRNPNDYSSQFPFLGKEFVFGQNDCFSLIRDYYDYQLNIKIKNYPRDENWYKDNHNMWLKEYSKNDFYKVTDGKIKDNEMLQNHDVILFNIVDKQNPDHAAVYIGDNKIIHHPRRKKSRIISLSKSYRDRVNIVLRHMHFFING